MKVDKKKHVKPIAVGTEGEITEYAMMDLLSQFLVRIRLCMRGTIGRSERM